MNRTTPRPFQEDAIASGLAIFQECQRLLDVAGNDPVGRNAALSQHGTLLLEAPTGAGKTLVAGRITEAFAETERVVWFWFAPFKGVTGQTANALRAELPGLRLRDLATDRQPGGTHAGDVWVTTWQSVAARIKDQRNVHRTSESNATMEELLAGVREQGLRVGVVVDEAHHSFFSGKTDTQAMNFFKNVLRPEYTVVVTATPDDRDVARFQRDLGLSRLNRITISRNEPVAEGLIKEGVKCVAYFAPPDQQRLVDFEATALRDAAALHRRCKTELRTLGVRLTPLMLVQVESTAGILRARQRLIADGFTEAQIATHTAEEPDPSLLALANDESREVLIFKMAVALGFDAPRAGILVSMRAARDQDYGVQLVGRILRVHRRLQGRARAKTLPPLLNYGYVFLADAEAQEGLDLAGQRINRLQTAYAKVSPTTALVRVAGQPQVQVVGLDGQTQLFALEQETTFFGDTLFPMPENEGGQSPGTATIEGSVSTRMVELLADPFTFAPQQPTTPEESTGAATVRRTPAGRYSYAMRPSLPRRFKTQVVSADNTATEEDCARRFLLSTRDIIQAQAAKVQVQKRTLEVFSQQMEMELTNASMDPEEAGRIALALLSRDDVFDPRALRQALLGKLAATLRELQLDEMADDAAGLRRMLNVLLVARPELLREAKKKALAIHAVVEEAEEELPDTLESDEPLPRSRHGMYGCIPPGLTSWERKFADLLDSDSQNTVRWWHRNLPHKAWSVQVMLDNGHPFFPDFVVGIEGRHTEDGALLTDPKFQFEIAAELPKSHAEHPAYGRVLILMLQGGVQWMTIRYDAAHQRAVLDREFRLVDAAAY